MVSVVHRAVFFVFPGSRFRRGMQPLKQKKGAVLPLLILFVFYFRLPGVQRSQREPDEGSKEPTRVHARLPLRGEILLHYQPCRHMSVGCSLIKCLTPSHRPLIRPSWGSSRRGPRAGHWTTSRLGTKKKERFVRWRTARR